MKKNPPIEIGTRFGHLTVIGVGDTKTYADGRNYQTSVVKCDCGKTKIVLDQNLRRGLTTSCGICTHKDARKHGDAGRGRYHPIYKKYRGMMQRCSDPKYERYFGRGIRVCEEWKNSYEAFKNWALSHGWKDGLSIDRIDPNGNYEPSNCRWITMADQMNNRTTSMFLTAFGETHTISEWSRITGIREGTIRSRISRSRWSAEKALSEKTKQGDENAHHAN